MLSVLFQNILLTGLIFVTKHVDSQTSTQQYLMLPPVGDWETLWNCELSGPMTQSSSNLWLPSPDLSDRRLTAASTICAVFWMSGISSARPSDPSSSCLLLLFTLLLLATNKTIHGLEGCNVIPSLTCSLPEHFQWGTSENLFFSCLLQRPINCDCRCHLCLMLPGRSDDNNKKNSSLPVTYWGYLNI